MKPKIEKVEPEAAFVDPPKPSEHERAAAAKSMTGFVRAFAWPVHRWPAEKRICEYGTKIHLPRTYLATRGEDVMYVRRGTDINQVVHAYYIEPVCGDGSEKWTNFVHADEVLMRRCAVLGQNHLLIQTPS